MNFHDFESSVKSAIRKWKTESPGDVRKQYIYIAAEDITEGEKQSAGMINGSVMGLTYMLTLAASQDELFGKAVTLAAEFISSVPGCSVSKDDAVIEAISELQHTKPVVS